jgi:prevent-host-death family protein
MERTVNATEARGRFGALMRQVVESQEHVIVERGGEPQVVVLPIAEYRRLTSRPSSAMDWRALVRQSRAQIEAELEGRDLPPAEVMLRQLREEQDEHLLGLR